jgi:MFS family permease
MSVSDALAPAVDAPEAGIRTRGASGTLYAWYVVVFLTIAATVSIIDRQILALMIGPMKRDLGVSNTMMGLLGGFAFTSFYTLLTWPMARLADSRSRRNIIGLGIFFWSLATISCGMAVRYWSLFMGRMGVGVGEATLYPAAVSMLSDYFDRTRLPLAIGIFSCASFIGIGLANILGGLVIQYLAGASSMALPLFGTVRSWQAMFILVGAPGIVLSLLTVSIREPLRTGLVRAKNGGESEGAMKIAPLAFFRARFTFLALLFGSLIAMAIQAWAFFFWIVELLVRDGAVSRSVVGMSFGVSALVFGTLGSLVGGWMSGRMMRQGKADATMRLALVVTLLLIPAGIATPLIKGFTPAMIVVSALLFLMGWPGGLLTAAMQLIVPNEFRGRMVALYFIIVNFVSFSCGPLFGGLISDHVFHGSGLGPTLALMAVIDYPIAAFLIWKCLPHFRKALSAAEAWQNPPAESEKA